jgi:Icc-related predicted phosphoesterase
MRIMLISDIHYSLKPFHGIDQSRVLSRLYSAIEEEKPDLLVSAGDLGKEVRLEMLDPIIKSINLLTIYGNHDDVALIKSLRNVDGTSCWIRDGEIIELSGLRVAGISGNIALKRRKIHHKTVEQVRSIVETYAHKEIDLLVTHEVPKHPSLHKYGKEMGFEVFNEAVEKLRQSFIFVDMCTYLLKF